MMQAEGNNHGSQSFTDDYSFEEKPLLPQHAEALRSRRRHGVAPQAYNNNINAESNNGRKYDKGNSYPDTIPTTRTISSDNVNGRPAMKINSIARIGRSSSVSIDQTFDDADHNEEEEYYYYFDDTNDFSWDCSFGTEEGDGIWLNKNDPPGVMMSIIVWILIIYSGITVAFLAESNHLSHILAYFYCTICVLALASHAKTTFTDPGAVPSCAVPIDSAARQNETHVMCRSCKSYKPPNSHHCRICNRCVSGMDHHCPWMNNCIGAANLKSFILFLCYTWVGSALALIIFGCNYFLCRDESCEFEGVLIQLVRVMTVICIGSILFVSSMLANVTFGVMTGSGTIDRLKRNIAPRTVEEADDPPLQLEEIFGMGSWVTWFLPIDAIFPNHDRVLGYSTPQRLLREGNENTSVR
mmetsp:Transcript_18763/g.30651  ORF Transcript_18763/g.30651 Transcript_18763/m.30651 type:complete len:412 (+) Transcript_18763:25-1260(+)